MILLYLNQIFKLWFYFYCALQFVFVVENWTFLGKSNSSKQTSNGVIRVGRDQAAQVLEDSGNLVLASPFSSYFPSLCEFPPLLELVGEGIVVCLVSVVQ